MTIKEVESRTELVRANIRYYESQGLISPVRRENGYREYTQQDVDTLLKIKLLRQLRFSMEEIQALQKGERDLALVLDQKLRELKLAQEENKSPQEVMEEAECQTCENRKYQDGSDDPGVSFKTATNVAPEQAASAVRGHEQEHVVREQAKAQREDRKVVSQSVTYRTAICPECGKSYVSGGTTRTVTAAKAQPQAEEPQNPQNQAPRTPFSAVA